MKEMTLHAESKLVQGQACRSRVEGVGVRAVSTWPEKGLDPNAG